ncbi:MAG: sulfite exporter TauE/SafE family protein [Gammaproteobacteria bacterium]|nr:sulfite exporter TauE/SafE family protein [Gammaproteobacteria bacterium]MYD76670.1 sulfite exporter TauE/SafE family protein [Gammaproteobacteria bacterium]
MSLELSPWVLAWCATAMACGGLIKGVLGVGTPLLTVPMIALVLPVHHAVVIMAIPVVVANLWQAFDAERPVETTKRFWPAFVALLVGTWIGVRILSGIDEQALLIVVGVLVICFTLIQGSPFKITIPPRLEKPAGAAFCGSAGLIGGLSSMFGPMMILYLVSLPSLDKNRFVNTISFLYVGAVVPWTVMLVAVGVLDARLALMSGLSVIPLFVGLVLGRAIRKHVEETVFYRLVLGVLILSGASMIWRAWQHGATATIGG